MHFKKYIFLFLLCSLVFANIFYAPSSYAGMTGEITVIRSGVKVDGVTPTLTNTITYVKMDDPSCTLDSGFISQIVSCVKAVVTSTVTTTKVTTFYNAFKDLGSGAIVLYIMFFGFKVMMGGAEKIKSEAFTVFITATFIVFFNQAAQITTYTKAFLDIQDDLVNVAVSSIEPLEMMKLDAKFKAACATSTDKDTCLKNEIVKEKDDLKNIYAANGCSSINFTTAVDKNKQCIEKFISATNAASACSKTAETTPESNTIYFTINGIEPSLIYISAQKTKLWVKAVCLSPENFLNSSELGRGSKRKIGIAGQFFKRFPTKYASPVVLIT
jgi:hypothetical protein